MEHDGSPVMKRNAIIALANIGTAEALEFLRHYKDIDAGKLGEYIAWAFRPSCEENGKT
jgi:epoxyqueuosine reductase QueG